MHHANWRYRERCLESSCGTLENHSPIDLFVLFQLESSFFLKTNIYEGWFNFTAKGHILGCGQRRNVQGDRVSGGWVMSIAYILYGSTLLNKLAVADDARAYMPVDSLIMTIG